MAHRKDRLARWPHWRRRQAGASRAAPPAAKGPVGLPEARAVNAPAIPAAFLTEERVHIGSFLGVRGCLEGPLQMLPRHLRDTEPHVEFTQRAARTECVGVESHGSLEMLECSLNLAGAGVSDPEHGAYVGVVSAHGERLLEQLDRFLHVTALERALGMLDGLLAV